MTEPPSQPPSYKDTLNLPKTSFEMKANLVQREPAMLARWQKENLYQQIRDARKAGGAKEGGGKWILHDGPPYANGDIHMGHLINKVLKDIVVKFRTMQGHDAPYVPGWDCHGLPIESAIQKELGPKMRELSKEQIRQKCHDYAMKYVKLQGDSFKRLGIFADYQNPYLTLDPKYEAGILDVLAELVQRDLVYRQKKPVHWCTFDRTALAEAELEYANRKDHSIYVEFNLADRSKHFPPEWNQLIADTGSSHPHRFALLIWTTTPWTLPANRAVAINPEHEYVLLCYAGTGNRHLAGGKTIEYLVVAKELAAKVMRAKNPEMFLETGWLKEPNDLAYFMSGPVRGADWVKLKPSYVHPLDPSRLQPVVLADYVTLEDGTGLVHTAPGHGTEDYQTGLRNHLDIYNPVLPDGKYDDTVPEFLRSKSIWDANALVIEKLKELGTLFHHQEFDHSYPHCWRCKKPVIFRATEQWFVKASGGDLSPAQLTAALARPTDPAGKLYDETLEKSSLWRNAVKFSFEAEFIPEWGRNRLQGMLATRPDWCISRQRSWGVPIPAFFDEKGKCLLSEKSIRRVGEHFKLHGADSWYTHTPAQILGAEMWTDTFIAPDGTTSNFELPTSNFQKGLDILDVWFESGASHHAVLECTHPELGYPADMYLEGSDQHRGWFQSSLLEAAGYKSEPPFKQVLTHGFVVDENGQKYSKSSGNYVPVDKLLTQHGADVLRLWVSSVDYQNDIKFSVGHVATIGEAYRKIRNTIRYLLGNLYDFNPAADTVHPGIYSINQWMTERADTVFRNCYKAYDTYEFHNVFKLLYEFCNVEVSAIYAKAIKDRLYCELPNSPKRRAAQGLCYQLLVRLVELTAPILVFTAEESWAAIRQLPGCASLDPSVHLSIIPAPQPEHDGRLAKHWEVLMPLVEKGNKQLDDLKKSIGLGNPLDAEAVIILPKVEDEVSKLIAEYGPEIEDALGVGYHRIEQGESDGGWDIRIEDTRQKYPSCARSWKRRPDVGSDPEYPDLSARDAAVVRALRKT